MADFNAIVEEVYALTNRRDLVAETQLAVKSATLQLHRMDYFYKDIREVPLEFNETLNIQSIEYRKLFPRYRALRYLRKFTPGNEILGPVIDIITPDQILDTYNANNTNVAYVAGSVIQIKSSTPLSHIIIGFYENPIVTPETAYSSWVADEAFYAVVYKAASIVFGTVLRDAAGQRANSDMADMEMIAVKNSNIQAEGY